MMGSPWGGAGWGGDWLNAKSSVVFNDERDAPIIKPFNDAWNGRILSNSFKDALGIWLRECSINGCGVGEEGWRGDRDGSHGWCLGGKGEGSVREKPLDVSDT